MTKNLLGTSLLLGPSLAHPAHAQAGYRNLDAGFPVRVEDATVTERYAFDLDLTSVEEWKSMAESMGAANMGGPAPVTAGNER
ncbi:MAG TPA: hypothetical protein VII02_01725 [Gemmatimonadaceae bacterium]